MQLLALLSDEEGQEGACGKAADETADYERSLMDAIL